MEIGLGVQPSVSLMVSHNKNYYFKVLWCFNNHIVILFYNFFLKLCNKHGGIEKTRDWLLTEYCKIGGKSSM